ncbi:hypothetical protein MFLAVUS_008938 [Mucor flavus]|uniref:Uncharacterized protein n=1 Tax=Mucor flavus TaxID=439312 RepID=A0ABP9Z8H8_9FUNG
MQGYLEIENSLYDLLASSGILFLQKDTEHLSVIKNHFSSADLKSMYVEIKSAITNGKVNFDQDLYFSVKDAIDNFDEDEDDVRFGEGTAEEYEARAITAIVYLWPELVSVQNRKFSEPQPRTPMFSGGNDISHCSNVHQTDSSRPDYKVDKNIHYQYYATPVFGEIKIAQYSNTKSL